MAHYWNKLWHISSTTLSRNFSSSHLWRKIYWYHHKYLCSLPELRHWLAALAMLLQQYLPHQCVCTAVLSFGSSSFDPWAIYFMAWRVELEGTRWPLRPIASCCGTEPSAHQHPVGPSGRCRHAESRCIKEKSLQSKWPVEVWKFNCPKDVGSYSNEYEL